MNSTRIALVTGANRGLGLETCRQLASLGYEVILTSRSEERGSAAAAQLQKSAGNVHIYPLDVTSDASIAKLYEYIIGEHGSVHVLINNAAVFLDKGQSILQLPLETFQLTQETNLLGTLRMCKVFLPLMIRQNYGRVVNVSSNMGQIGGMNDYGASYRLSKLALNGLTRILADATRGKNVLVNAVSPGWVNTDMGGASAPRTVEQGAKSIVWAATLPDNGPSGGFFLDGNPLAW